MKGQAPPPLPPSSPSQRLAPPVIEVQKSSQLFPVTPPKERSPVTSRLVLVALVERSTVDVSFERLVEVVAATRPSLSVDRTPFVIPVSHALPEKLASVVEELANDCNPVHVLLLARRVEDAAVTVTLEPRAKSVPLMVPSEPEISPEPIVVVDTSFPFSSVESRAEARKEKYCDPVDVAFTASVEEAMRRVPFSHSAVVVL